LARRLALISRSALGFGATEAFRGITNIIESGYRSQSSMQAQCLARGIALSDNDVVAVAAYVWAIAQR
jgi:hypothetical protein